MDMYFNLTSVASALLFAGLALVFYLLALRIFLPIVLSLVRKEFTDTQSSAVAIIVGFISLGLSIIIAAAVH
jgi:uncharacterized membrane protein YjfL (UPF0719 family)